MCPLHTMPTVDLLKEGVVSKEEYERLVQPVKERKRKAERMAWRTRREPATECADGRGA